MSAVSQLGHAEGAEVACIADTLAALLTTQTEDSTGALCRSRRPNRSHLQSGSPCPHTGKRWRSGDWAEGGRERSKVNLKILILRKTNGQGEGRRERRRDQQQI